MEKLGVILVLLYNSSVNRALFFFISFFLYFNFLIFFFNRFEAFGAIKEGLKQFRDSWKLWDNAFLLSLEVGDFSFAVKAINRLLDLRRNNVQFAWIKLLADYVTKNIEKGDNSRTVCK